ncbi:MAG: thiamine biosynthesis lipoprotein [Granulosicoccus sp.]
MQSCATRDQGKRNRKLGKLHINLRYADLQHGVQVHSHHKTFVLSTVMIYMKPIQSESERPLTTSDVDVDLVRSGDVFSGRFRAMANPCEILVDTTDAIVARRVIRDVVTEVRRIEAKYSRYRSDSVISQLNNSEGRERVLDPETARLFNFAAQCYTISGGAFDVTSGVLREIWCFDGTGHIPLQADVKARLERIGFNRLQFDGTTLTVPQGMEVDFGGIAKEYAVDRAIACVIAATPTTTVLVNLGGDLAVTGAPRSGHWFVGQESASADREVAPQNSILFELSLGALATSGDRYRSIVLEGRRYGHVLDPRTGWPVEDSPNSVTVADMRCTEAGVLSTLALLQGLNAEAFLEQAGCKFWCQRLP